MWKQEGNILCESYAEIVLKRIISSKKARISLVPLTIPSSSRYESLFNLFFVPSWIWSCSCVNGEKISFSCPDFEDAKIAISGLTSLTNFYKRVHLSFRKQHVSNCQKKISFVQITPLKLPFLTPNNIKSYY